MFICTGNICRSAMAEAMLKKILKEQNNDKIEVCSAGVYAETGDIPTKEAVQVMQEYGIDLTHHHATNINDSPIEKMDLILCATASHKRAILQSYPNLIEKVFTIKEYAELAQSENDYDISDPWGYSKVVYQECAKEIEMCLKAIIKKITNNKNEK